MQLPVIRGVIDRRLLVNFRVAPEALSTVLPSPFRPKLVGSVGIAGICLIRLRGVRPRFVPKSLGIASENAAHRIAVEWGADNEGVYIPRRDTSSVLNALAGGRLFPGVHHRAIFDVTETSSDYSVSVSSLSGKPILRVRASLADSVPFTSVFADVHQASCFFETGSIGYSPSPEADRLDGLELRTRTWNLEALQVSSVASAFFEDTSLFPPGSVQFDSAFLMRNIEHEWHSRQPLHCSPSAA
jgi:hypothetical protein